jgi:hypothetical protein
MGLSFSARILSPRNGREKNSLAYSRERRSNGKIILPIWHNLGREEILEHYPTFADRIASKSVNGIERVVSDILTSIQASQRTKEVNVPIMSKLETLANKATVRERSDQLRNSQEGVFLVTQEVQRLFALFQSYLEPYRDKLGLEIMSDANHGYILARRLRFTLQNPQSLRDARKSRIAFRCEYPPYATSGLYDISLKVSLYHEITDVIGRAQPPQIILEWKMRVCGSHSLIKDF